MHGRFIVTREVALRVSRLKHHMVSLRNGRVVASIDTKLISRGMRARGTASSTDAAAAGTPGAQRKSMGSKPSITAPRAVLRPVHVAPVHVEPAAALEPASPAGCGCVR